MIDSKLSYTRIFLNCNDKIDHLRACTDGTKRKLNFVAVLIAIC